MNIKFIKVIVDRVWLDCGWYLPSIQEIMVKDNSGVTIATGTNVTSSQTYNYIATHAYDNDPTTWCALNPGVEYPAQDSCYILLEFSSMVSVGSITVVGNGGPGSGYTNPRDFRILTSQDGVNFTTYATYTDVPAGGSIGQPSWIAAPTNLNASVGNAQIVLSWTGLTGATGYNVKRSITADGPYTTIASNVTGTNYIDSNVIDVTTYYYVVSAVDATGEGANSNEVSAMAVTVVPVPGAGPLILKNNAGALSSDGLTLTGTTGAYWGFASVSDTQYSTGKYRFTFRFDGGYSALGVASTTSNMNGYYVVGLNDINTQRGICVATSVDSGAGQKFPGETTYCEPFTLGDVVEMEVDFDSGTMEYFKNSVSLGVCFNDVNTLPKPLYVIACAVNSGKITLINVSGGSSSNLSAPNLTATAGNSQVTLSWTAVAGATGYNVKRSITAGGPYTTIAANVTGTSYIDNTVTNGTTYYYVVTAVDATSESANSNEASATPNAVPVEPGQALLRVTMLDSSERIYQLTITEIDGFINWFNQHAESDAASYMLNKKIGLQSSKEYLVFEKIISFEVIPVV